MAKIKRLPSEAIISGFKKTIDFYVHDGQPCARSWPSSPGHRRSPGVQSTWPAFAAAAREWNNLSPEVQASYNRLAEGTGLSGRDLQERAYLTGLYRYPLP